MIQMQSMSIGMCVSRVSEEEKNEKHLAPGKEREVICRVTYLDAVDKERITRPAKESHASKSFPTSTKI
jgi:hypothetical protein